MSPDNRPADSAAPLQEGDAAMLLEKALKLQHDNALQEAEQHLQRIINGPYHTKPDTDICTQALDRLCALYRRSNAYDQIISCCRSLLKILPDNINAHYFIGAAYQMMGENAPGLKHYQRVLELDPDHIAAHLNSGILLERQQQFEQARHHYKRLIEIQPEGVQGYIQQGMLSAQHLGQFQQGLELLQHAIELAPEHVDTHFKLGTLYHNQGNFAAATKYYKRVLALDPENAYVCYQMADICEMTNRLAEAQQYLQQGERLAPDHPLSHRLAATLLRRQGRVDEALARLEAAPLPENNPLLAESIHFELGRLYERRQDSASAYAHYQQGNRLLSERPEAAGTDKHAYLNMIQTIRQTFTPEWLTTWSAPLEAIDTATPDPIFLVGFPRSGTTLLDQILSSHASLQVIEEQPLIADIRRELASTPAGYLATLADMNPDRIQQLRHHYLDNAARYLEPEKNGPFVDKLPLNIVHLGLIIRLFPNARIILALRHPCDVCLSCFMQAFAPNDAMANFYTLEDAARLYAEVMGLWHHYASLLALNYHPIKYEDIVADFEGETRRLLDFLGLEWDPRVLEYNKNARQRKHINTPSYNQVTEEIYTRARYRWQRYENQLRPVMPLLAPFIDHFNY